MTTHYPSAVVFYSKELVDGKYPGSLLDDWKIVQDNYSNWSFMEGDCFPASFGHLGQTLYGPKVGRQRDRADRFALPGSHSPPVLLLHVR